MIWADQTLNEGLRIGMNQENIDHVMDLLQELEVGMIDCNVRTWQGYDRLLSGKFPHVTMRGKVSAIIEEVKLAYHLGFKSIMLTCVRAPDEEVIEQISKALLAAQGYNMKIALCIEYASRFSVKEIEGLWRALPTAEVLTFVYSDGESLLNPLSAFSRLSELVNCLPVPMEFHGHNAYGLATANALSAIQAGVKGIAVSVAGVGQYGHAALEEVIMAQKCLFGQTLSETEKLSSLCSQVLSKIGVMSPRTKAIIGDDIFAHESGIHVDGVIKNPKLYEAFSPEDVGLTRKIIIGKHSGTASIVAKFKEWNVIVTEMEARCLLKEVRKRAVLYKKSVDDNVLWELYQSRAV